MTATTVTVRFVTERFTMVRTATLLGTVLLAGAVLAQRVPPQTVFNTSVQEDGTQAFEFRVVFPDVQDVQQAESAARASLPGAMAEKRWCLNGWTVVEAEATPIAKPKSVFVSLKGTCRR